LPQATGPERKHKFQGGIDIGWVTVTYRSVFLYILGLLVIAAIVLHFAFPQQSEKIVGSATNILTGLLQKIGSIDSSKAKNRPAGQQKASFTMIDGAVKVKKQSSNSWVTADYNTPLEKGDVVQTGPEGMAKIVFADLTNYTVKQDSLIVIEENSTTGDEKTNVAVQVTTGTVDLSTATYSQGSKSQVIVAGATATLAPESSAQVKNDPRADQREILVTKGSGEVTRAGEIVSLSNYEKVSFRADSPRMSKEKEVGPPILIEPANMLPVFSNSRTAEIKFAWTPMENTREYRVRVATNPYFSGRIVERIIQSPEMVLADVGEGAYYWSVQSIGANGRESMESERNRFTVIPRNTGTDIQLALEPFVQHGRIIEVRGKTDSSARVMVNGGEVPIIQADGSFRYMTPPLPNGENMITVTAQNAKGGVNTQTKRVVIQ
jgi:hypothetical protein